MASTQVVDEHAFLVDVVNNGHVTLGQVDHVDVVTHTSAVGRVVVVAVDLDFLELADRDLGHVRGEVRRNTLRVFAQQAGLVRADRVEVAQQHDGPGRIGHMHVAQNLLLEQLGGAVRVGGAAGRRLSVIGNSFGVPYTVAEEEKMIFLTLCFFITLSSTSVEYRLLS